MKKVIINQTAAWLPVILWAYMIFRFSAGNIPVASQVLWQDFAVKKVGHLILFGVLSTFIYRAFRITKVDRKHAAIWAIVLATLYGVTDEFHQMFTQGREARVRDIFIDGFGASLIMYVIYNFLSKMPKKMQSFLLELGIN